MDLKQLQAVLGIADTGSFSAAAAALGTVQSNVSAHVAHLERELEVVLVERSSGRLTEEGEVVVARTRRMMAELDAMVADVVAMRHEVRGTVRLGMIGTAGRWLVPLLFAQLRGEHSQIHLTVTDGTNTTLEPQLASGQLDLAVVSMPVHSDELAATPLFDEDLVLAIEADHPLVHDHTSSLEADEPGGVRTAVPMSALDGLELVLPAPGTALREEIDTAAATEGAVLRACMEVDGVRMIASLTFDGYGPSILPATAVPVSLRRQFALLPIEGLPPRRAGVALRVRGLPSAPARVLMDVLFATVRNPALVPEGLFPADSAPSH